MEHEKLDRLYDQLLLVTKALTLKFESFAKATGYNRSEFIIIRDILDHPLTTQQKICERTGLKKSSVSKTLNRLIESDVVKRSTCTEDRRELELIVENDEIMKLFCKSQFLENMFSGVGEEPSHSIEDISIELDILLGLLDKT